MKQAERYILLSNRLARLNKVSSLNAGEEEESATLAHSFLDLEKSFKTFSEELLPKIFDENTTDEELGDVLTDIGEEFRHIVYHLKDPKYYRYITE